SPFSLLAPEGGSPGGAAKKCNKTQGAWSAGSCVTPGGGAVRTRGGFISLHPHTAGALQGNSLLQLAGVCKEIQAGQSKPSMWATHLYHGSGAALGRRTALMTIPPASPAAA